MGPLSYTQISLYQSCPLSYKLQYIDGLRRKEKWYFSFGSTIHSCAEHFFRVKVPPPPTLEELLRFYEKTWLSEGYPSAEEEARYKAYGRQLLTSFWMIHSADFRMPIAVERQFNIDIGGVKVRGYIDRIDKLDSGGLYIVDYKTSQGLFTKADLETDLQLTLYQMAVEQTWQLPVEKLALYHMRSNTVCACKRRSKVQLEEAKSLVVEVAENIAAGNFPATENQFCPCDFPEHCPYHKHKFEVVAAPEQAKILRGTTAHEAVERYVSLQEQVRELETELEEVKQMLIGFCHAGELNRVYGTQHAVTCKMTERYGYDEDKVKTLLEPLGLWDRVLGFDQSKLKQVMSDPVVAQDLKSRLEALKQVLSSSPRLWVRKLSEEDE